MKKINFTSSNPRFEPSVSDESRIGGGEINLFSDGWDLRELNWDQPGFSDVQR
jgi:hypothetical protein